MNKEEDRGGERGRERKIEREGGRWRKRLEERGR